MKPLARIAPTPACGSVADGYERVAETFARQLRSGRQIGGSFCAYRRGERVVDLWGGMRDRDSGERWERDTRIVVFSVTKGLAAMALHLLASRGQLDWDAPVAEYWPTFARAGKSQITVRTLINHRAGLPYLDVPLTLHDVTTPERAPGVLRALEAQRPCWPPGEQQAYHALTFGMYVSELFARVAGVPMGEYLERELFIPLASDARIGADASFDDKVATLYPPTNSERVKLMGSNAIRRPDSIDARMFRAVLAPRSVARRAFSNPATGPAGVAAYNEIPVRRSELAWASATASADGIARAYLPFANDGAHDGVQFLEPGWLDAVHGRQGWSPNDPVLQKPVGWSLGFLKEEVAMFSPNVESFGHAGMGGTLGWADPVAGLSIGYVMNRMDWRIRSARALELCHALYACEPLVRLS